MLAKKKEELKTYGAQAVFSFRGALQNECTTVHNEFLFKLNLRSENSVSKSGHSLSASASKVRPHMPVVASILSRFHTMADCGQDSEVSAAPLPGVAAA